jgi:hypothetical protein
MSKFIKISIIGISVVFFSGCSLSGSTAPPKTTGSVWKSVDGGKTWVVKNKTINKSN